MAAGGALRAAEADFGAALQHRHHHGVGDADAADQERHGAEPEQQAGEGDIGCCLGGERAGGAGDVDRVGRLGVGGGGEKAAHGFHRIGIAADVKRGDVALEIEVALARRPADQRREVEHRHQRDRREDADHGEPAAAEPHRLADQPATDAEPGGGSGAEHHGRIGRGSGVEPGTGGDAGAHRLEQVEPRRVDGEAARLARLSLDHKSRRQLCSV